MIYLSVTRDTSGYKITDPVMCISKLLFLLCVIFTILIVPPAGAVDTGGITWIQAQDTPFLDHTIAGMTEYNSKIWLISGQTGSSFFNDVWSSPDGETWTLVTDSAPFAQSSHLGFVVLDNRLVAVGGDGTGDIGYTHVWTSRDGITWDIVTDNAPFTLRVASSILAFNGKIWIIGGNTKKSPSDPYWALENDVWYSSDGITWNKATNHAAFSPRSNLPAAVFDDKMWIAGGWDGTQVFNDVWYSRDGIIWTPATRNAAFQPRSDAAMTTLAGKLWVIGGSTYTGYPHGVSEYQNDVWSSTDGTTWVREMANAPFTRRNLHKIIVFNDRLWLVGGFDGKSTLCDLWYSGIINSPGDSIGGSNIAPSMVTGPRVIVNKTISPWSIKQGTDTDVAITITNLGSSPIHDIEILDESQIEFPVVHGQTHYSIPQLLLPNETRILRYTVHTTKSGSYVFNRTTAMFAGDDGNYHKIQSNAPTVVVLAPLISPESQDTSFDIGRSVSGFIRMFAKT
jgi:hypothetical protein